MANVIAQLVIKIHDDQSILVEGPIDGKILALGALEVAKEAIIKHHDKLAAGNRIVAPPAGLSLVHKG